MSTNDQKISIDECRKLLCKDGEEYSDEDILRIRDLLDLLAEIAADHLLKRDELEQKPKS